MFVNRELFNKITYGVIAIGFVVAASIFFMVGHVKAGIIFIGAIFGLALGYANHLRRIRRSKPQKNVHTHVIVTQIDGKLSVKCGKCGGTNIFDQPYAYHAGFGDQGFLYSESGHFTLTWSLNDPAIKTFFPPTSGFEHYPAVTQCFPQDSDSKRNQNMALRENFEKALPLAPDGSRWLFKNCARCLHCSEPIAGSIHETVYYLVYSGSIMTDKGGELKLGEYLKAAS